MSRADVALGGTALAGECAPRAEADVVGGKSTSPRPSDTLNTTWQEAQTDLSLLADYIVARGLPAQVLNEVSTDALRIAPSLPYYSKDDDGKPQRLGDFPAMVASVTDSSGQLVTLQRTYLQLDAAGKLNLPELPARKLMPPTMDGSMRGASIKLQPAGSVLGLAEGIETALAVTAATGQHCWSCVSAHGLEMADVPTDVQTVHIWADNDVSGAGQKAARVAAAHLCQEGRRVFVHIPHQIDEDWLDVYCRSGAAALLDELTAGEEWHPGMLTPGRPVGVKLSTVRPEHVLWLWPGRIPLGKLCILDGDPGLGKSTLTLDIASRVTTGRDMPDAEGLGSPAGVVLITGEDGIADTVVPRLKAAGANLERVRAIDTIPDDDGGHPFVLPDDIDVLERVIREDGARLVIIDPIMAFLGAQTNAHRDQDVRRVLARLHAPAERTGAAILLVRHLNKAAGGAAIYRGGGSIGLAGAARSVLVVARDPENEDGRILATVKCNLHKEAPSLSFRLESTTDDVARLVWQGTSNHGADSLLALPASEEDRHAMDEAKEFLVAALADGPVSARELLAEARNAGISERTLKRAKTALGVRSEKLGMKQGWVWIFPSVPKKAEEDHHPGMDLFGETGTLREQPSAPTGPGSNMPMGPHGQPAVVL